MSYYAQTSQVNTADTAAWLKELELFDFPKWCRAPIDALEYATYNLKAVRKKRQDCSSMEAWISNGEAIEANELYSLVTVTSSFFAWLFTKPGSDWLLDLFGISEIQPHHGFAYQCNNVRIGKATDSNIRIFNKSAINRYQEPAYETTGAIDAMKQILFKVYAHKANKAPMLASDGMWRWTLSCLRNWFTEPVDKVTPYPKGDRINGMQWARNFKDPERPSETMWSVIEETEKYHPRAYRIEQRGGVLWCGRTAIRSISKDEDDYHQGVAAIRSGQLRIDEETLIRKIHNTYRCNSCDRVLCCTDKMQRAQNEKLCDSCFGKHVETGSRDTLSNCTYSECSGCPNYIRNTDDLKNLKYQLDEDYAFPVKS
ncbi:hypothetical protein DRQ25_12735 [Candidatus Fermentibacteria bacterium]|nr:MAG: hypothetical protein DRQ25_12735 [Candidatus Fermentibacteria bacterium]